MLSGNEWRGERGERRGTSSSVTLRYCCHGVVDQFLRGSDRGGEEIGRYVGGVIEFGTHKQPLIASTRALLEAHWRVRKMVVHVWYK